MATLHETILAQIDAALGAYDAAYSRSGDESLPGFTDAQKTEILNRLAATIDRLAPPNSQYRENSKASLKSYGADNSYNLRVLAGILRALRADYAAGFLQKVESLVQADLFSDFLEMAEHLLAQGYKDPAAVLIGGVLEEHLRKLCLANGVAVAAGGKPKKADTMNAELAGAGVYNKLDQKAVTAWLDLRNNAAHGKYTEYTRDQVQGMLQGVSSFLTRHLA